MNVINTYTHRRTQQKPLGTGRGMIRGQRLSGGGQTCGRRRQAEGGRDPYTGEPLSLTGTRAQVPDG